MANLYDLNSLPASLQNLIQTQELKRTLEENITAHLHWSQVAQQMAFPGKVGGSMTMTRTGLRPANLTERTTADSDDLNSGLSFSSVEDEQFTITCKKYADGAKTNITATAIQSVGDEFLINAKTLAEQAARSKDTLARNALFDSYTSGHTRVKTTLGSAGPVVAVDDARGFAAGDTVIVGSNAYTVASVAFDGSNASTLIFQDSGALGKSGSITFSTNVTINDGTAGKAVDNHNAPIIVRAGGRATTAALTGTDYMTLDMLLDAKVEMETNNIPQIDGAYNYYASARQLRRLWDDPMFANYHRGGYQSADYKTGVMSDMLGVRIISSNLAPVQNLGGVKVHRGALVGAGALVEADFTNNAYAHQAQARTNPFIEFSNGIAFITNPPLDVTQEWVKQVYVFYTGFVAPTDKMLNSTVMPSANDAIYKRAVTFETLV